MHVELLDKSLESKYENFLFESKTTTFYNSIKYKRLLQEFLQTEAYYFLAMDDTNKIKGAFPAFLKRNKQFGNILNSLPFYGSYGAIIEHENNYNVKEMLLEKFNSFAKENSCISATIICSPFEPSRDFYKKQTDFTYKEQRIGQITALNTDTGEPAYELMKRFDGAKRRNIRKALNEGITAIDEFDSQAMDFLADTHLQNMKAINGIQKPRHFFNLIQRFFNYGTEYKIYSAFKKGRRVAALLLFYFNKTVEYFTPVVLEEFKTLQPLSLLIFEAMQDASKRGFNWWNWGGTWPSQQTLYNFKKRWDAIDFPYTYYIRFYEDSSKIVSLGKAELLEEYKYFYIIPFSALNTDGSRKIGTDTRR